MSFLSFVCILGLVGSITAAQYALVNRATYTFQNKGDLGVNSYKYSIQIPVFKSIIYMFFPLEQFLTAVGGRAHIAISDRWRDGPAQKWQVVKGCKS